MKFFINALILSFILCPSGAKKGQSLIQEVEDLKEFKKLLRRKTNLLVVFAKSDSAASKSMGLLEDVAEEIKGKGTLGFVDCSDAKKLCKNLKASPSPLELRHYKDGDFNKNYDRKMVQKSMVNFMMDPTGDIPWEEEADAKDVVQIESEQNFNKMLKKEKVPILVMFYAPWCGFCKRLKPDFAAAATEVKGQATLVGVDLDKPQLAGLRTAFNITGFPTLYYFERGQVKYKYGGENNKDGIIKWLKNPTAPEEPKPEATWEEEAPEIAHLHDSDFDSFIQTENSVLVMFYAPWCGHCKKMKPEYQEAAQTLKNEGINGVIAAVDATQEKKLGDQYKIQGFPTVKYFRDGAFAFDVNERSKDKIIEFMKDPKEPPPPPEPEASWEDIPSEVVHLTDESFKSFLKKKKHALVMFYAPWCGHCKKAKPEYMQAAAQFADDPKVVFGAMDCTIHKDTCSTHDVNGYPTFKYFNYGKNAQKYMGGREEADFVKFMKGDPLNPEPEPSKPPTPSQEESWADVAGKENLALLGGDNFDSFIQEQKSVLVMFYAPWCGHCKAMKPAYGEAANTLKAEGIDGVLAAVDATVDPALANKFEVKGYPTLKYFKNGAVAFDYQSGRQAKDLVSFMKNPVKSVPPAPEPSWSSVKSNVKHLSGSNFTSYISGKDAALVMFYAPWCGHCKKSKPAYQGAADKIKDMARVLAAVDCTASDNKDVCEKEKIQGFPTIKLYIKGEFLTEYNEGRTEEEFFKFVMNAPVPGYKEEL